MRALVARNYGPADTLRMADVPVPEPGPGQIQVRVKAASLNPADLMLTSGVVREAFETTFPFIPGSDFAGTVTELGPGIDGFAVGDEVFGFGSPPSYTARFKVLSLTSGALAEYATFQADGPFVVRRPDGLSPELAASLASTGLTAAAALQDGAFQPGEKILVIGATGGIGSILVPLLAREKKAEVIATTIPEYESHIAGLGAAESIDYLAHDVVAETLRRHPEGVDAIVNTALHGDRLIETGRALRPGGRLLSTTPGTPGHDAFGRDDITVTVVNGPPSVTPETLPTLAARALDGTVPDMISRWYGFDEADRAYRDFATAHHTRGKFVISMCDGL
ncbi:NADP-dependent oxidoreductase [Streptosporangium sp. NBC_01639]|uniref:NADP-dependent oxidoreductase n=1 Tax=Streptosporangium sp. NBC_01639 TaxID=2975948 RepID=UPI0038662CD7|nr:NADP-dependent oxidoreductase [Streptosporangium sp. NBC_01639]